MVAPVFVRDQLVAWVANRAHHADLGGIAPGSMPPDAVDIDEEGLRLAPTRLTPDVVATIVGASRTPEERRGDLDAQCGANVVGAERLATIIEALDGTRAFDEVVDYGERRMRAALAALPDGTYRFTDALDSAGPRREQQHPVPLVVTLTISEDTATFDFTGTGAQQPGNVNAVEPVTVAAVAFSLRAATDPTIPANGGALRPVRVVAPSGTVVAAVPPVAVGAGNVEVSQRVADVCLGALAIAAPDRLGAASQGTMNNVIVGSAGDAPAWVYYETLGGGQGGRPWAPGMNGVHTGMTNTADTPVEALERELPMRVRRYSLRTGSGGAGEHAGGDGIERELEMLEDGVVSLITERRTSAPWGARGGAPGAVGENWLLPDGDEARGDATARQGDGRRAGRRRAARAHSRGRRMGRSALGAQHQIAIGRPSASRSGGSGRHRARPEATRRAAPRDRGSVDHVVARCVTAGQRRALQEDSLACQQLDALTTSLGRPLARGAAVPRSSRRTSTPDGSRGSVPGPPARTVRRRPSSAAGAMPAATSPCP